MFRPGVSWEEQQSKQMSYQSVSKTILFLDVAAASRDIGWLPGADVYRSRHGWLIKLDLAGVRQRDLTIEAAGNKLVIRGCRRDLVAGRDWSPYTMEIAYTRFERVLELPCRLDRADINAELNDGMLLIFVVPKEGDDERS